MSNLPYKVSDVIKHKSILDILEENGIVYLDQLFDLNRINLLDINGLGANRVSKIEEYLVDAGFFLDPMLGTWRFNSATERTISITKLYLANKRLQDTFDLSDIKQSIGLEAMDIATAGRNSSIEALNKIDRLKTRFNQVNNLNKETRDLVNELGGAVFKMDKDYKKLQSALAELKELKELLKKKQGFWSKLFGRGK